MNTRFAVATHVLTYLACRDGAATSAEIAASVGTHPALVRRIAAQLADAGLLRGQRGAGGGCTLARPAAGIRLVDVYRAVVGEECAVLPVHSTADARCPVGRHMQRVAQLLCHQGKTHQQCIRGPIRLLRRSHGLKPFGQITHGCQRLPQN